MKRAALYLRVSTLDQHPETQLYDLRQLAQQRGYEIVQEYTDKISGAKAKRPGLDQLMADARHGRFQVVVVWAFDRLARSVRHFLEVLVAPVCLAPALVWCSPRKPLPLIQTRATECSYSTRPHKHSKDRMPPCRQLLEAVRRVSAIDDCGPGRRRRNRASVWAS